MELSIVTTMYCSAAYLKGFYERVSESARKITSDYEIIFVNDGSPDESAMIALGFHENDEHVKVIDLSRNFGHHKAIMAGLRHAEGEKIFLINCDVEESPENLSRFYEKFAEDTTADVVYGMLEARKGGLLNKSLGYVFYSLLNWFSGLKLDSRMAFSRLMTRRYVKSLLRFGESELFLPGLWYLTGYKQVPIIISSYYKGKTTYTLRKKVSLLVNAVTSFSDKPLIFIFYLGLFMSFISGFLILYVFIKRIAYQTPIIGWTSLIVSLWFIGGLLVLLMGVLGIYLSKIFVEAKRRPYTISRKVYDNACKKKP